MTPKVLIIGAGLAGLALAHILHEQGVPYELFERDEAGSHRSQGWAVALVECLPPLEKLLPSDIAQKLHSVSVNANTPEADDIAFVDAMTGETVGKLGGVPQGDKGYVLRVSRERFRTFLLESRQLHVSMGKNFTHYTETADGVTAHFKDGSSAQGTLLLGADGLHSHTLDQLVGKALHNPVLSRHVPICGQVDLPKELYEPIRARSSAVILAGAPGIRAQIGMLHMEPDGSKATYFWAIMIGRDDPTPLSDWVSRSSREEVFDFVAEETDKLHPAIKDLVRYGGAAAIARPQPKFVEYEPSDDMPRGRVTILGDAGHTMIPFRAAGANTAILDACDLGRLLTTAWEEKRDFATVVAPYLEVMVPRGRQNVIASRKAGEGDGNPAEEWAVLFRRPDASN